MIILLASKSYCANGGGISSFGKDFINIYNKDNQVVLFTGDKYIKAETDNFELYNVDWNDYSLANAKRIISLINQIKPDIIYNSAASLLSLITPYLNNEIKILSISHFVNGKLANTAGFNSKYIDTIVTLSNYGTKYIKNFFHIKNNSKVSCVYNFQSALGDADFILNKKKKNNCLIIVYPGGSSAHKSPDVVFKIVSELLLTNLKFKFIWLGNTKIAISSLSPKIKTIKEMFPHDDRLIFTGQISRFEAQEIIQSANMFLLPSRGEGCPISLLEAMRVGTIPLVSDSKHASRELIENEINGYVIPIRKPSLFVSRIENIILNHSRYGEVYDNCLNFFSTNLNSTIWKNKMDGIFNAKNKHKNRFSKFNHFHYVLKLITFKMLLKKDRIREVFRSIKLHVFFRKFHFIKK
ncbi:glycosyltransferase family 4 protein [Polaribacter atrinae]|uniref:glycosyltransferase family 4 protein n=1 Tax=Polaribacter atrinae TaxID=1333662 RepID=UPI0030F4D0D1